MAESLIVCKISGYAQIDNFEDGIGEKFLDFGTFQIIKKKTLTEVFKHLEDMFEFDNAEFYQDDTLGIARYESSRLENDDGREPSNEEIKKWRSGEIDLWTAIYFFEFYNQFTAPISDKILEAIKPGDK